MCFALTILGETDLPTHHAIFICHRPQSTSWVSGDKFIPLGAVGNGRFRFSGAYTSGVTQLPIPNSTVKL